MLHRRGYSSDKVTPGNTKTDAVGRFAFQSVAPGEFRIWTRRDNRTSRDKQMLGTIIKADQKIEPVNLTLKTRRMIQAAVISASFSTPIAGAIIRVAHVFGFPEVTTDAEGCTVINGVTRR